MIEKIYDKIESYHIFNYAVPGALLLAFCKIFCGININEDKILFFLLVAYFLGIVISRIGSLLIEGLLNYLFKIKKEKYCNYIVATKNDSKIEVLMQDNNMYRNICTMLALVLLIKVAIMLNLQTLINVDILIIVIIFLLIILFSFSYKKQENIIISRVKIANEKKK